MAKNNRTIVLTDEDRERLKPQLGRFIFNSDYQNLEWGKESIDVLFLDPPYNLSKDFGESKI